MQKEYDAILVLGGGLISKNVPKPWAKERLDEAIRSSKGNEYIITLSAGTTHKPPFLDSEGFPVFEADVMADYLKKKGVNPKYILAENCSYDTIGNAYFSRMIHAEPRKFLNLLIITNSSHMPRTKEIFDWIYNLEPSLDYNLDFREVPDIGMEEEVLEKRNKKESEGLEKIKELKKGIFSLEDFHKWLYQNHGAYSQCVDVVRLKGSLGGSY